MNKDKQWRNRLYFKLTMINLIDAEIIDIIYFIKILIWNNKSLNLIVYFILDYYFHINNSLQYVKP